MAPLRLVAAAALLLAASCYTPSIEECTVACGPGGACPFEMTCRGDGFCHADETPLCAVGGDGGVNLPDARRFDARPDTADARPNTPDAAVMIDARQHDARMPDAGNGGCVDTVGFIEDGDDEDATFANLTFVEGGHEHITYIDERNGLLRYVHRVVGGDWSFETVGPAAAQLKGQTVDSHGGVHVAFTQSFPTPRLAYAYRPPAGGWRIETVDDTALAIDAAIAVDEDGVVNIVYWYNQSDLLNATQFLAGTDWFIEPIDTEGTVGEHPAIAIGPGGALHVSYRVGGSRLDLGYARLLPLLPFWDPLLLDSTEDNVGAYTAIAVDRQGTAHIAYSDFTHENLKYATIAANGTRRLATADETRFTGRFNSIAVDSRGGVHISTFDYGLQDLRYLTKAPGGTNFRPRVVDSAGNVGRHSSLAVDSLGVVHIAYIDDGRGDLKYATICP